MSTYDINKVNFGGDTYRFMDGVALTQAEYDALSTAEKNNGTVYYIIDGEAYGYNAEDISATDKDGHESTVQNVLDLLNSKITTTTVTLLSTDWSNDSQTVSVAGVTTNNSVIVSPAPASMDDYSDADIRCTTQTTNSLTFTCGTEPTSNISVNVLIID